MRAAVVPKVSAPWEVQDVPTPSAGPGEVLVRVRACGVCGNDVGLTRGGYPFPPMDPVIVGHEAAGEVVEVGAGVSTLDVGDRVGTTWVQGTCGRCDYCREMKPLTGQSAMNCAAPSLAGMTVQGGHAEYIAIPADSTVRIPDQVPFELAAPVLCAGYTAWSALRVARVQPSERVAVLGIGGLGHLAVQFASACGFETVAITSTPGKQDAAKRLGADLVVFSGEELRAAGGADVILQTGSSFAAASEVLRGLRPDGRLVLAGIDPQNSFTIPPDFPFFAQGCTVMGATHGGLHWLGEAFDLVASGRVAPVIEEFPLARVNDAVERVARGDVRFRAVVTY
ncbi:alcohol dehydrogenase [Actinomadura sp. KC06]|uniref:alcohol dehydrogenase catalytic domain-containing protein n=1 Tax=Actinomadura sp. KC06 TaxID=2530369 RepID=UPI00104E4F77|nr:alcohol dehydrogenase catalytic domain-containing protein [Actinomadura sp. KC06]TDD33902.1 alcohol dehydrogenase [Actinomadura sp. KC06]